MWMDQGGKFQTESKSIVHASYDVSLLVAKAKKPYSIGETLIKPCLVSCAGILPGESAVSKMMQVSLSNDTVKSRICDMSCNIKSQLLARSKVICDMSCNIKSQLLAKVKASPVIAIQLDESVDVENLSTTCLRLIRPRPKHRRGLDWKQQPKPPTSCSLSRTFSRRKDWTGARSSVPAQMGLLLWWVRGLDSRNYWSKTNAEISLTRIVLHFFFFYFPINWEKNNESFHSPLKYCSPKFQFWGGEWRIGSLKSGDLEKKVKNPCFRANNSLEKA